MDLWLLFLYPPRCQFNLAWKQQFHSQHIPPDQRSSAAPSSSATSSTLLWVCHVETTENECRHKVLYRYLIILKVSKRCIFLQGLCIMSSPFSLPYLIIQVRRHNHSHMNLAHVFQIRYIRKFVNSFDTAAQLDLESIYIRFMPLFQLLTTGAPSPTLRWMFKSGRLLRCRHLAPSWQWTVMLTPREGTGSV